MKLRKFVTDRYEYDEKSGRVKASDKVLNRRRKLEARNLIDEEMEYKKKAKIEMNKMREGLMPKPQPVGLAPSQDVFDPDHRPRYASTKMTPDECEERGTFGGPAGAAGIAAMGAMTGVA